MKQDTRTTYFHQISPDRELTIEGSGKNLQGFDQDYLDFVDNGHGLRVQQYVPGQAVKLHFKGMTSDPTTGDVSARDSEYLQALAGILDRKGYSCDLTGETKVQQLDRVGFVYSNVKARSGHQPGGYAGIFQEYTIKPKAEFGEAERLEGHGDMTRPRTIASQQEIAQDMTSAIKFLDAHLAMNPQWAAEDIVGLLDKPEHCTQQRSYVRLRQALYRCIEEFSVSDNAGIPMENPIVDEIVRGQYSPKQRPSSMYAQLFPMIDACDIQILDRDTKESMVSAFIQRVGAIVKEHSPDLSEALTMGR